MYRKDFVTIIGGSGFIGGYVCGVLHKNGIPFEILDLKPPKKFSEHFKYCDIREKSTLIDAISGSTVINLAAVHSDDVINCGDYYKTNVEGMHNLISVAKTKEIKKIIFTSSVAVYGPSSKIVDETKIPHPLSDYGKSKLLAEKLLIDWAVDEACQYFIIRPTAVFGPGGGGNIRNLIDQIISKKFAIIGSGSNKKSLAYVENLADFIFSTLNYTGDCRIVNYVDDPDLSVSELTSIIANAAFGVNKSYVRIPTPIAILVLQIFKNLNKILGRSSTITPERAKKFASSSQFSSRKEFINNFSASFDNVSALKLTVNQQNREL